MRRIIAGILCLAWVMMVLAACAAPAPSFDGIIERPPGVIPDISKAKIAIIYHSQTGDFWSIATNGAKAALEELKANKKITGDSYFATPADEGDVLQHMALIDAAVEKKVDGIVLSAANADQIGTHISDNMPKLADGGIPIIAIDRSIYVKEEMDCVISTVQVDIKNMSQECGKMAYEALGGKGEYVYIEIDPWCSAERNRFWSAQNWLAKNAPEMELADVGDGGFFWTLPAGGVTVISPFIKDALTKIDEKTDIAFLAMTEAYAIEIIKAIKEAKSTRGGKTVVVGFDFSQETYDLVVGGELYGAVGQNPYLMGYNSVYLMVDYLNGGDIEEFTYAPFTVVKQDTLDTAEVKDYLALMQIETKK